MTRGKFLGLYLLFLAAACAPVLAVDTLPLLDWPNHLARIWILYQNGRDPILNLYYRPSWALFSNLSMDLIVPPLVGVLGLYAAGKAFLLAIFLLLTSGCAALYVTLWKRWSAWPLLGFAFLYSETLILGFANYLFAAGCALWATVGWIRLRNWRWRLPLFALIDFVLLVFHLYGFGLFGLAVLSYELSLALRARRWGPFFQAGLPFIPPLILFAIFSPTVSQAGHTHYGGIGHILRALAGPLTWYNVPAQLVATIVLFALLLAVWRAGGLRAAPHGRLSLVLLAVTFLAMPSVIFGSAYAQFRFVPAAILFLLPLFTPAATRRAESVCLALAAIMVTAQLFILLPRWRDYDRGYAALNRALDSIPRGSKMLVAAFVPYGDELHPPPWEHHALRAIVTRGAFVPSMYTRSHGFPQPVALTPYAAALMRTTPWCSYSPKYIEEIRAGGPMSVRNPFRPDLMPFYDYALVIRGGAFPYPLPRESRVVASDGPWALWQLHPGAKAGKPDVTETD